jgi:hypothetical protein
VIKHDAYTVSVESAGEEDGESADNMYVNGTAVYQWCGFKSRRGKNNNLTALKSNSNTVWFNFQTYIYILYTYMLSALSPSSSPALI